MSCFQNFAADATVRNSVEKKKLRSARFFETALRAVLINSLINGLIRGKHSEKLFSSLFRSFNGKITEYHPASDNYSITCQDGNSEMLSHSNISKYVKGAKQYEAHHINQLALNSTFHTALSSNMTQSNNVPENYKDAIVASDVAAWM